MCGCNLGGEGGLIDDGSIFPPTFQSLPEVTVGSNDPLGGSARHGSLDSSTHELGGIVTEPISQSDSETP